MLLPTRYLATQKVNNVRSMWAILGGKLQRTLDPEMIRK